MTAPRRFQASGTRPAATLALALGALAVTLLAACSGQPDEPTPGGTILSLDGRATAVIPAGALPSGVALREISLETVAEPAVVSVEGTAPLAAYRLLPAGLDLQAPVTLTLRIDFGQAAEGLYALHLVDGEVEPIADVRLETNPESESVVASVRLPRAGELYWWGGGLFRTAIATPSQRVLVGERFTVTAAVERRPSSEGGWRWRRGGEVIEVGTAGPEWTLTGGFFAAQGAAATVVHLEADIRPARAPGRPDAQAISAGSFSVEQEFVCAKETGKTGRGGSRIWYEATIEYRETFRVRDHADGTASDEVERAVSSTNLAVMNIECLPGRYLSGAGRKSTS